MTPSRTHQSMHRNTLAVCLAAALAACGGGGDKAGATPTVPAVTTLTLTGIAATGAAIVSGAVEVKCQAGIGTATTNAAGSFTVSVTGGSLPCLVRVTAANGSVLHSVAEGSGTSATVNISPLTELIVAQAAGGTAASLYASFDAAAQAKVGAAALTSAQAVVAAALQSVVSLAGVDPIKGAIVAGSGTGLDGQLDTLAAALAGARLTVADVSAAIVANGAAASTVITTQVQPAAATCASAHGGAYRLINPNEATDANRLRRVTFNTTALTFTAADGSSTSTPAAPVVDKPCQFSADNGATSLVISSAGVVVERYTAQDGSGLARLSIGIPEQIIPLADLAGTWNSVEMNDAATFQNNYAVVTLNAAGSVTAATNCAQLQNCTPWTVTPGAFSVNADGGYTYTDAEGSARFFAYRAPSGDLMMIGSGAPGGLIVLGKQRALALPTVPASTPYWDLSLNNQRVAGALLDDISTVAAVNNAAGTYTRSRSSDGRVDTFAINAPRTGMRYRAANSCSTGTGMATNCNGIIVLPLQGMGLSVYGSSVAGTDFYGISITKPAGSSSGSGSGSGTGSAQSAVLISQPG